MSDKWEPPKDVKPWMVCAACRHGEMLVVGPRHFDPTMWLHLEARGCDRTFTKEHRLTMEQGFIDQWGRFYTREEAMGCVKASGQPFNLERNGGQDAELFSEGLY